MQRKALLLFVFDIGLIEATILGPIIGHAQVGAGNLEQTYRGGVSIDLQYIFDPFVLKELLGILEVAGGDPHGVTLFALLLDVCLGAFIALLHELGGLGGRAAEIGTGTGAGPAVAGAEFQVVGLPVVVGLVVQAEAEGSLADELMVRPGLLGRAGDGDGDGDKNEEDGSK